MIFCVVRTSFSSRGIPFFGTKFQSEQKINIEAAALQKEQHSSTAGVGCLRKTNFT